MGLVDNMKIGADIEWFVADKTGKIVSAEGYIQGTKAAPFKFDPKEPFFATQLDNVLAEGNIPPAANDVSFRTSVKTLQEYIDGVLKPHGLYTVARAAARLEEKYLQTENAKTFGCDPSLNCWTLKEEEIKPTDPLLRSAGFHIHVGYDNPNEEVNIAIARLLDCTLGVASVLIEPPNERRKVGYGRSGSMRHQPHGCEYRSLSSYYADSKNPNRLYYLHQAVYSIVQRALGQNREKIAMTLMETISKKADEVQEAINTSDRAAAWRLKNWGLKNIDYCEQAFVAC